MKINYIFLLLFIPVHVLAKSPLENKNTTVVLNEPPTIVTSEWKTNFWEADRTPSIPVIIDNGIILSGPDNTALASATVSITQNFRSDQDNLDWENDEKTMGNITLLSNSAGVLSLTSAGSTATMAEWQSALRAVTYLNLSETPAEEDKTISFLVNDGTSNSLNANKIVKVWDENDMPEINVDVSLPMVITEDLTTAITGISFSDIDIGNNVMKVSLTPSIGMSLSAKTGGSVVVSKQGVTWNLTGTLKNLNAFFANSQVLITPLANSTTRISLRIAVEDDKHDMYITSLPVDILAVNDAPTISAPGSISINKNESSTLIGILFLDVDAGDALVTVVISTSSGLLYAAQSSEVTVLGTGTNDLSLTGSIAQINSFIATGNLAINTSENVGLNVSISDKGNTGTGGNKTGSVVINVITSVLPVDLISFSIARVDNGARLEWSSASEQKNSHFEIKRSADGLNFHDLVTIIGKGNTADQNNYSFFDSMPLNDLSYYKLVQMDTDGRSTDLGTRVFKSNINKASSPVTSFPNPATNKVTIIFGPGEYTKFELSNLNGDILQTNNVIPIQDNIIIHFTNYPSGMYLVKLIGENRITLKKVIKY
ncbi:T9SS type A sorting domain-containing protein [Desertivirga xinjiangensis]|uniref:T9SS type A sorting domain-containing protein n=1 Tax=Desertivirga xinjiangensis TaxID=539206 RepID=UPI00210BEE7D|nr:T9SS type A sorting domain-containing protein [Pedobacter xinjiangensis]